MRYFVSLDADPSAKPVLVDVNELPSGALSVTVDGRPVAVDVAAMPAAAGAMSVIADGRVVDLVTDFANGGAGPELDVLGAGVRTRVRVESERAKLANAANKGGAAGAEKIVKSPMPGRVVKLLVKEGDDVVPGQALLVVEAMKMENEVKAKAAAKVATIHVVAGATVEGNAKLITLS